MDPRIIGSAHSGPVHALAYNSTGRYLLSGGQDRRVCLWNAESGTSIKSYQVHGYEVLDIVVTPDDAQFASCGGDRTAFVCDVATGAVVSRFSGHIARINSVAFNVDASVLGTASFDATVKLWDLRSGNSRPVQTLSDAKDSVSKIDIGDHEIVAGSVDGKARVYDVRIGRLVELTMGHAVTSVARTIDGSAVLVSTLDSTVRLMDVESGVMLGSYGGHTNKSLRIKSLLARNDAIVVSASEDGQVHVWDVMSGRTLDRIGSNGSEASLALAVHPQGSAVATATVTGDLQVWTLPEH